MIWIWQAAALLGRFFDESNAFCIGGGLSGPVRQDKAWIERSFQHLTPDALNDLERRLRMQQQQQRTTSPLLGTEEENEQSVHFTIAQACIRRIAYQCLDKYSQIPCSQQVKEALNFYTLPNKLQEELANKYRNAHKGDDGVSPRYPTWYHALEQLKRIATSRETGVLDTGHLWRLILDHPMTSYVPLQCQACGHVIPDEYPPLHSDADVGLQELSPTGNELGLRAGWFRGPRSAVVFQLSCPSCHAVSQWYRSGHARMLLNPNRWGRLCGEQEDLRLALAQYLRIPVRLVIPLDWDHVWSEYQSTNNSTIASSTSNKSQTWQVQDENARNFACRLDEGIGCWTRVWAINPDPSWCQDVTQEYLTCRRDGGRADDDHAADMERFRATVYNARSDVSGQLTQARTIQGHVIGRANLSDEDITRELQRAAQDYGIGLGWWHLV